MLLPNHKVQNYLGVIGNEHADALADVASFSPWYLIPCVNEHYILADGNVVFGNSKHFVYEIFQSIQHARWEVGLDSRVLDSSLHSDVDWFRLSLVWHSDLYMAAGFINRFTAGVHTYFMKALHYWLPVAVQKQLYNRCYPSMLCLYCGKIKVSDHAFSYAVDNSAHCCLLDAHATAWSLLSGCFISSLSDFVFKNWLQKAVSVFEDAKIAGQKIIEFVCNLCLVFRDEIWLVHAKHCVYIKKNDMIPSDSSAVVSISGLSALLSVSVVKLLGIAETVDVGFDFCKSCLFFSDIGDSISVHISV
ncbi:hypothetical protein G9A89_005858 [Geosiphon pyriformis]|nr:hypothetical protein G9A89_005858 [Geosiphon pyriformis]